SSPQAQTATPAQPMRIILRETRSGIGISLTAPPGALSADEHRAERALRHLALSNAIVRKWRPRVASPRIAKVAPSRPPELPPGDDGALRQLGPGRHPGALPRGARPPRDVATLAREPARAPPGAGSPGRGAGCDRSPRSRGVRRRRGAAALRLRDRGRRRAGVDRAPRRSPG